jgi:hypothetical protein
MKKRPIARETGTEQSDPFPSVEIPLTYHSLAILHSASLFRLPRPAALAIVPSMKIPLILLLFAAPIATARIGETVEECRIRYGDERLGAQSETQKYFRKNDIDITLEFRNGIAVRSHYSAKGEWGNLLGKLTEETIREILKMHAPGMEWNEQENGLDAIVRKEYKRSDGEMYATWDYSAGSVSFVTRTEKETRKIEEKLAAAEEKKKADSNAKKATTGL